MPRGTKEKELFFSNNRKVLLEGKVFGELSVIEYLGSDKKNYMPFYRCLCSCGKYTTVSHGHLQTGHTKSCGDSLHYKITHGKSNTRLYEIWISMKDRCYNPNNSQYHNYGGRGITVAQEFLDDFLEFEKELGPVPDSEHCYSIDRIDVNKGYVKGNLRWATPGTQARNRRKHPRNTSGATGVTRTINHSAYYWIAFINLDRKRVAKYFSIKKLGEEEAYRAACKAREELIAQARLDGYDFSLEHGK